jgi:hypothetical protein
MNIYLFEETNNKIRRYVLKVEKETNKYYFIKPDKVICRTRINKEFEIGKLVGGDMIFLLEDDFKFARFKFCEKHLESKLWYEKQAEIQHGILEKIEKLEKAEG